MMSPGGPVEVLMSFGGQGMIQHLGVAGGPIDLMIRFVETDLFEAVITHNRYTLVNRSAEPALRRGRRPRNTRRSTPLLTVEACWPGTGGLLPL